MRKLLIGIVILLVVVGGGVVAYAFVNVNGILADNRERLAGIASDAVGRQVAFESTEIAFSGGLAVRVAGLRVAEDPGFGKADFLTLDSAYVGVKIWPALFGRFEVSGVRLEEPVIRVVSSARGWNFSTIGTTGDGEGTPSASQEESAPLALAIAALEIEHGTVYYEDRTSKPPLELTIASLSSSATDIALEGPLTLSFSGLLKPTRPPAGGDAPSSRVEGAVALDDVATAAGTLRLRSPEFYPSLVGVSFEDDPKADRIEAVDLEIGLPENPDRDGYPIALKSTSGHLAGFDFEDANVALVYRGDDLVFERVLVGLAGGAAELTGKMKLAGEGKASPFDLDLKLEDIDAGTLATALLGTAPGLLSGKLRGDIALSGKSFEWETLKRTLAGKIALEMGEGALESVNLLDRLVGRMVADPGLGALLATSLRDVAPSALKGDRTEIRHVGLGFDVADGTLTTRDLEMVTSDFVLSAIGKIGLDGAVAGDGKVQLSDVLSQEVVAKSQVLATLTDEGGRVELPIQFGGTASAPSIRPNVKALAAGTKRELRDKAVEELSDQIFGKRKKPLEGETVPADAPPTERDAAEGLLREGFGRLLGK